MTTIPIESHLHTLNIVVTILALVAIVPVPSGPGLDRRPLTALILGLAALAIGACMMVVANVAITANDFGFGQNPGDWRSDAHSPEWTEQYVAFAVATVVLCLAVRLPFTRGVRRRWAVAALVAALASAVIGSAILASS